MGFPRQEYWSGSPFPCVCLCLTEYMYNGILGFPGGSDGKEYACNVGDLGLILGLGRSPGEGKTTHSSIFAWRIPWTKKLQSTESQSQIPLSNLH